MEILKSLNLKIKPTVSELIILLKISMRFKTQESLTSNYQLHVNATKASLRANPAHSFSRCATSSLQNENSYVGVLTNRINLFRMHHY